MVRQNENDVRCDERESNLAHADGTRPRVPSPPPPALVLWRRRVNEGKVSSRKGKSDLCSDRRWIDQRLDNYRETFATSFSLSRRGREGMATREGWASAYFPNANGRNNPYFTSRWHRVVVDGGWDFSLPLFFSCTRREKREVYSQSFHGSFPPPFAGGRGELGWSYRPLGFHRISYLGYFFPRVHGRNARKSMLKTRIKLWLLNYGNWSKTF